MCGDYQKRDIAWDEELKALNRRARTERAQRARKKAVIDVGVFTFALVLLAVGAWFS